MTRHGSWRVTACLATLLGACSGSISGQESTPPDGVGPPRAGGGGPKGAAAGNAGSGSGSPAQLAPARARRLTETEIANSLRDVYLPGTAAAGLRVGIGVSELHGFDNDYDRLGISVDLLAALQTVAERVASEATKSLGQLSPCDVAKTGEATCAGQFIDKFGLLTWRRPLTSEERARLLALFTETRKADDYATSIATVIEALVQSPAFLFRPELAQSSIAGAIGKLTPYELASALSYFLWSSGPDGDLLMAAGKGKLVSPADVEAQARRMLQDPRARDSLFHFVEQWIEIEDADSLGHAKSATAYPGFNAIVAASLREESRRFVESVVWSGDGRLDSLLGSNASFANADVAKIYGITDAPSDGSFEPVMLDSSRRAGLLTQPAFLASLMPAEGFSPIQFGRFVKTKLFCQSLPSPPMNVPPLPPASAATTTRQRFAMHSQNAACAGCHALFEQTGWAFETFDSVGGLRDSDHGTPVTGAASLQGTDVDGSFRGPIELTQRLTDSQQVARCFNARLLQFAVGRDTATADFQLGIDAASLDAMANRAVDGTIKDALVAAVLTDSFSKRDVSAVPGGKP